MPISKNTIAIMLNRPVESISDEQFNRVLQAYNDKKTGILSDLGNQAKQGAYNTLANQATSLGAYETATSLLEKARNVPVDQGLQNRIAEITEAPTYGEAIKQGVTDPTAVAGIVSGSLLPAAEAILAGTATAVAGAPGIAARLVAAGTQAGASYTSEYGGTLLQLLSESGVDIRNPDNIAAVVQDPEFGPWLREKGNARGIPVAVFDSVAMGLAGKIKLGGKTRNAVGETGVQSGLGMSGEAGAQIASEGQITKPGDIVAEGLGEAVTAVPQAVIERFAFNDKVDIDDNAKLQENIINKTMRGYKDVVGDNISIEDLPADEPAPTVGVKQIEAVPETLSEKNKAKARAIDRGEGIAPPLFPKEIARGTYVQNQQRLMRLSKRELLQRAAINNAFNPKDLEGSTKSDIVDQILTYYGIKPNVKKAQTPKAVTKPAIEPTSVEQPQGTLTQEQMTQALDDSNLTEVLTKLANDKNPRLAGAAKAWLNMGSLPSTTEAQAKAAEPKKAKTPKAVTKPAIEPKPVEQPSATVAEPTPVEQPQGTLTQEQMTQALDDSNLTEVLTKLANDKNPRLAGAAKAWLNMGSLPSTTEAASDTKTNATTPAKKDVRPPTTKKTKKPKKPKVVVKDTAEQPIVDDLVNNNPVIQEVEQPTNSDVEQSVAWNYVNKLRDSADSIMEFLGKNPDYKISKNAFKEQKNLSTVGRLFRSYDMFRSMMSLARKYEPVAVLVNLFRDKQAFRHNVSEMQVKAFANLAKKHGVKRIDTALSILDDMSAPTKNGSSEQKLVRRSDGRLAYVDATGKGKVADKQTSDAVFELQDLFKQSLAVQAQSTIADLEQYGIDASNSSKEDILAKMRELRAIGDEDGYNAVNSAVTLLDKIEAMLNSDIAYFPHVRAEGPYAVATYRKNKDGDLELAGLYSVQSTVTGNVDGNSLTEVHNRIRQDALRSGETFYDRNGRDAAQATPFYKNKDNLRNLVMKNATDSKIAFEVLASMLATKGIDTQEINNTLDSFQLRDNIEKMFLNMRERKGYYGYDNADRMSTTINFFLTQSALMANYRYNPKLAKVHSKTQATLATEPELRDVSKRIDDFYNYMSNPADDADFIRTAGFWYFLAGNPSTGFLQFLSTYTNTLPWLSQFVGPTQFAKANVKSVTNLKVATAITHNRFLLNKATLGEFANKVGMSIEDAKILLDLKNEGVLDPGFGVEAVGDVDVTTFGATPRYGAGASRLPKSVRAVAKPLAPVAKLATNLITVTEEIARVNTVLLTMDALRNPKTLEKAGNLLYESDPYFRKTVDMKYNGNITKSAIIRQAVDENHGVFGKVGRAQFMRGKAGALAFPFLTYPIQIMEQLGRLLMDRGPDGRRAFAAMALAYPVMFGGLMAVPGYELWDWLLKWYKKIAEQERTNLEIVLNRAMMDLGLTDSNWRRSLLSGPFFTNVMDVDASARISNSFWFQPLLDVFLPPDEGFAGQNKSYELLGGAGSVLHGGKAAIGAIGEGENPIAAVAKHLGPTPLRNVMKGIDIAQGDVETTTGKRLLPKGSEDVGVLAGMVQAAGFRPQVISQAAKYRYQSQLVNDAYKDAYASFNDKIAEHYADMIYARKDKDFESYSKAKQEASKAIVELIEFNRNLPKADRKPDRKLMSDMRKSVKRKVQEDLNPLTERQSTKKTRSAKQDAEMLALPWIEDKVKDR